MQHLPEDCSAHRWYLPAVSPLGVCNTCRAKSNQRLKLAAWNFLCGISGWHLHPFGSGDVEKGMIYAAPELCTSMRVLEMQKDGWMDGWISHLTRSLSD